MTQKELFKPQKRYVKHIIKFLLINEAYTKYNANLYMFMASPTFLEPKYIEPSHYHQINFYEDKLTGKIGTLSFLDATLIWRYTLEGSDFWNKLDNSWRRYIDPILKKQIHKDFEKRFAKYSKKTTEP